MAGCLGYSTVLTAVAFSWQLNIWTVTNERAAFLFELSIKLVTHFETHIL